MSRASKLRAAVTAASLVLVVSGCGQFAGVHRPATSFRATVQDRRLVTYIVKFTTVRVLAIPPKQRTYVGLYQRAAGTCPGLPWQVLAAIGTVESDNGMSTLPGVHSGANFAGAEGPMQMLPGTFAAYAWPVPPGGAVPPNPYDPVDAVYAAARDLCANGAWNHVNLPAAIFAYNHANWYVTEVLQLAARYAGV